MSGSAAPSREISTFSMNGESVVFTLAARTSRSTTPVRADRPAPASDRS
jgi:hypothetical protein